MHQNKPVIVVKYGGNAMTDASLKAEVIRHICEDLRPRYRVVVVHGGGPFIAAALDRAGVASEFVDGLRVTTPEALVHVETALKGLVNSSLVELVNRYGARGVGLSGKDGAMVMATKRTHIRQVNGRNIEIDLGRVGEITTVDVRLLESLLSMDYLPVLACLAAGEDGGAYNVNGDVFAGAVAGALGAQMLVLLTDVDGLLRDKDRPSTLIRQVNLAQLKTLREEGIIQGGMIPKTEACVTALKAGAQTVVMANGTRPSVLSHLGKPTFIGTLFQA